MISRLAVSLFVLLLSQPLPAPQEVSANFDFVPGARVLFADDFSRDRVGNFPQRFELFHGTMEVVETKGQRFLRVSSDGAFGVSLPETLPQRFTIEFDLGIPWNGMMVHVGPKPSSGAGSCCDYSAVQHSFVFITGTEAGVKNAAGEGGSFVDPRSVMRWDPDDQVDGKMVRIRIQADGAYIKVYMNETRIANVPNADFGRSNKLVFESTAGQEADHLILIGNLSVNAGGKSLYDALVADGRVVTQGIYFDVNSDRIRPESQPTLQLIADMLKEHADLKLGVEGHTDNTGSAAANQTLSEKRAQAIVSALAGKFGVTASRLTATGFGATKPAASNDTLEGRQQNRRVELVRK